RGIRAKGGRARSQTAARALSAGRVVSVQVESPGSNRRISERARHQSRQRWHLLQTRGRLLTYPEVRRRRKASPALHLARCLFHRALHPDGKGVGEKRRVPFGCPRVAESGDDGPE